MTDKLPTWMTCCDGRGLRPPKDYIGPVVRKRDGQAGFVALHCLVYAPSPAGGAVEWLRHVGNTLTGPIVPPDDAGFLLDLDRDEGFDAGVRKLGRVLGVARTFLIWHRIPGSGMRFGPIGFDPCWQLATANSGPRWRELDHVGPSFAIKAEDPREALALALAQQTKEDK